MIDHGVWSTQRIAAGLLLAGIIPLAIGVALFLGRGGVAGGAPRSSTRFAWERGSIMAAVILTALGLLLLETLFRSTAGEPLGRLGASAYFLGAAVLVTSESLTLSESGGSHYPLIVIYVVVALLGQAAIGGALLLGGLLPAWIGWSVVAWNLGWLVILPLATPGDMYFPVVHHAAPLLIGVALVLRG